MYRIIGGDQQEYGPVDADQIRVWIAEGRLNRDSRIRVGDSPDWTTVGACPEFANAFSSAPFASLVPSAPESIRDPLSLAGAFATRGATLDIGSCFSRSWVLLTRHFWLLVGASALMLIISIGFEFIPLFGTVANAVLGLVFWGGLDWLFLRLVRGAPASFADAFAGFRIGFVQLMLAGIVTTVLITVGLAFCILPGLYLMMAWLSFGSLLIMDKQMSFWPALELNRRVVTKNFGIFLALFLVTIVILVAGALALGVGILVALPLCSGAIVYAYEDIFGSRTRDTTGS